MTDILVFVKRGDATYEDGDVLVAMNRDRIRCVHAEHLCSINAMPAGRRAVDSLAYDFLNATSQYRFERTGPDTMDRVVIATGARQSFGSAPVEIDGHQQHMEVADFVARRLNHDRHRIFGTAGAEVWFGGSRDVSTAALDAVWAAINARTGKADTDAEFQAWPFTEHECKTFLALRLPEVDAATAESWVASEYDETDPENPVLVRKRSFKVDWRALVPAQVPDILDPLVMVDLRDTVQSLGVVEVKP